MPIFRLSKQITFPPPELAEDGLLAVGGDLCVERLLLAYRLGIFPWYSEGEPILWWSPDPRMILRPGQLHVSARLLRVLRQGAFRVTMDTAFDDVIMQCASVPRKREDGTWITPEMIAAYSALHHAGYAHSLECWRDGALAGGIYGVSLGACFFGESMFHRVSNASKVAITALAHQLLRWDFRVIDCQVVNNHLRRLGAKEVPRAAFLKLLRQSLHSQTRCGRWHLDSDSTAAIADQPAP